MGLYYFLRTGDEILFTGNNNLHFTNNKKYEVIRQPNNFYVVDDNSVMTLINPDFSTSWSLSKVNRKLEERYYNAKVDYYLRTRGKAFSIFHFNGELIRCIYQLNEKHLKIDVYTNDSYWDNIRENKELVEVNLGYEKIYEFNEEKVREIINHISSLRNDNDFDISGLESNHWKSVSFFSELEFPNYIKRHSSEKFAEQEIWHEYDENQSLEENFSIFVKTTLDKHNLPLDFEALKFIKTMCEVVVNTIKTAAPTMWSKLTTGGKVKLTKQNEEFFNVNPFNLKQKEAYQWYSSLNKFLRSIKAEGGGEEVMADRVYFHNTNINAENLLNFYNFLEKINEKNKMAR